MTTDRGEEEQRFTRRQALRGTAALTVALAGCNTSDVPSTPVETPTPTPTATETQTPTETPESTETDEPTETPEPVPESLRFDLKDPNGVTAGLGLEQFSTSTKKDDVAIPFTQEEFNQMYWDDIDHDLLDSDQRKLLNYVKDQDPSNMHEFLTAATNAMFETDNNSLDKRSMPYMLRHAGREVMGMTPTGEGSKHLRTWYMPVYDVSAMDVITMVDWEDGLYTFDPHANSRDQSKATRDFFNPVGGDGQYAEWFDDTEREFAAPMYQQMRNQKNWEQMQWKIQRALTAPVNKWSDVADIAVNSGLEGIAATQPLAERNKQNYLNHNTEEIRDMGKAWIGIVRDIQNYDHTYMALDWKDDSLAVYGTDDQDAYEQVAKHEARPEEVGMEPIEE